MSSTLLGSTREVRTQEKKTAASNVSHGLPYWSRDTVETFTGTRASVEKLKLYLKNRCTLSVDNSEEKLQRDPVTERPPQFC